MHSNWHKIIEQIGSIQRLEKNLLAPITLNSSMKIMGIRKVMMIKKG